MAASLTQVRLAQLRARATRGAVGKIALGFVFLVGALAHARAQGPHDDASLVWMAVLLVMSTLNVALGLRLLARVRRRAAHLWMVAATAWGVLALAVVALLVRR